MINLNDKLFANLAMTGFASALVSLNAFAWGVKQENATIGDTVSVPYITNNSGSSLFSYGTGYEGDGNAVITKDVTLSNLLYQKTDITDAAWSKLEPDALARLAQTMGQALARDVISASLAATVNDTNFPTSASCTQNQLSSSVGMAALVEQADTLKWSTNRSMILSPSAWSYMSRNADIATALNYGTSDPIQKGTIPFVQGFVPSKYSGVMPKADLKGIVCDPSAIIVAMGVHTPAATGTSNGLVNVERSDSDEGLMLQFKRWYAPEKATTRFVVECLFGCELGNRTGLVQMK